MNTLLYLQSVMITFIYQIIPDTGDGDTDIDVVPIDNPLFIIMGISIAIILAVFMIKKTSNAKRIKHNTKSI